MSTTLTHRATHEEGWEVDIYIAPSLQAQLANPHGPTRAKAEDSVSIRFREACSTKYGPAWRRGHRYVEWQEFNLTVLEPEAYRDDDGLCDNCPSCEANFHDHCDSRYGCPNAAVR